MPIILKLLKDPRTAFLVIGLLIGAAFVSLAPAIMGSMGEDIQDSACASVRLDTEQALRAECKECGSALAKQIEYHTKELMECQIERATCEGRAEALGC